MAAPLRVTLFSSEFPPGPGGIGTHAHQLARQLAARHWDVSVLASQDYADDGRVAAFNREQPFPIQRLGRAGSPVLTASRRLAQLARQVRANKPDLLVASGERVVWLASALATARPMPYVSVGHAPEFNAPPGLKRTMNRVAFGRADAVVCVSEYTRSRLEQLGAHPGEIAVIPNGADDSRFRVLPPQAGEAFRRERGFLDKRLLITVGGVHQRKGQDLVIRALPHLPADVHYLIAGMPLEKPAFSAIAAELGVSERVHFLGVLDAATLLAAVNAADLFVMTSRHTASGDFEGFGIAVVEAALCGRAAVVTEGSGLIEAIEPGVTGLAAREEDPLSIAAQINVLLADRPRLAAMEQAALARAKREQTWDIRGRAYDELFRRVTAARRGRPSAT
jgi:phosphatidyl-myo-inositol dimannoside synthase